MTAASIGDKAPALHEFQAIVVDPSSQVRDFSMVICSMTVARTCAFGAKIAPLLPRNAISGPLPRLCQGASTFRPLNVVHSKTARRLSFRLKYSESLTR